MTRRRWIAALSLAFALCLPCADRVLAAQPAASVRKSRWWSLACEAARTPDGKQPACTLTVRLRGSIDSSRLHLFRETQKRRDDTQRALRRDVAIHVDVDSRGGQIFAAMEIGRILRSDRASISVARGAWCTSACVFVMMGAPTRSIASGAQVGIHRPSIHAGDDALVAALPAQIERYVAEMGVSRAIVADMMAIPSHQMRMLSAAELDAYGMRVSQTR